MAKTRLSKAAYVTRGYGQVEPNHLSAQRTAQIYAQLPAASDIDVLENGQFVKYDYANGEVNFTGAGEWMLVFNEVKLYDTKETYKDYAMTKESQVGGVIVPRVLKTNVGDIYTTNFVDGTELEEGELYLEEVSGGIDLALQLNSDNTIVEAKYKSVKPGIQTIHLPLHL